MRPDFLGFDSDLSSSMTESSMSSRKKDPIQRDVIIQPRVSSSSFPPILLSRFFPPLSPPAHQARNPLRTTPAFDTRVPLSGRAHSCPVGKGGKGRKEWREGAGVNGGAGVLNFELEAGASKFPSSKLQHRLVQNGGQALSVHFSRFEV
ncbi:hypothetical protein NL676_032534 [Syzygium grande]|nr:hypothetical protein NL676_032534 [Syzygium grande]